MSSIPESEWIELGALSEKIRAALIEENLEYDSLLNSYRDGAGQIRAEPKDPSDMPFFRRIDLQLSFEKVTSRLLEVATKAMDQESIERLRAYQERDRRGYGVRVTEGEWASLGRLEHAWRRAESECGSELSKIVDDVICRLHGCPRPDVGAVLADMCIAYYGPGEKLGSAHQGYRFSWDQVRGKVANAEAEERVRFSRFEEPGPWVEYSPPTRVTLPGQQGLARGSQELERYLSASVAWFPPSGPVPEFVWAVAEKALDALDAATAAAERAQEGGVKYLGNVAALKSAEVRSRMWTWHAELASLSDDVKRFLNEVRARNHPNWVGDDRARMVALYQRWETCAHGRVHEPDWFFLAEREDAFRAAGTEFVLWMEGMPEELLGLMDPSLAPALHSALERLCVEHFNRRFRLLRIGQFYSMAWEAFKRKLVNASEEVARRFAEFPVLPDAFRVQIHYLPPSWCHLGLE